MSLVTTSSIVAVAVGVAIRGRLDTALTAMHRPGDVAGGFGAAASPSGLWAPAPVREVLRAWRDWNADRLSAGLAGHLVSPYTTVVAYAVVDLILVTVPVSLALMWAAGRTARRMDSRSGPGTPLDRDRGMALRRIAELARYFAVGYLALHAVIAVLVPLAARYWSPVPVVSTIGFLTLVSEIALFLAVVPLVFAELATARQEHPGQARERILVWLRYLVALRAQVAAALLIAGVVIALQGDIGLQVDDVAMRWLEYWPALAFAVLVAVFTSWLMLLSGEVCWYRHLRRRKPGKPFRLGWLVAIGVFGIVLIATGFVVSNVLHYSMGDFVVWPGIALLLYALLSLPQEIQSLHAPPALPGDAPAAVPAPAPEPVEPPDPPPPGPPLLLWVVATVPLAALGVIAARAATTLSVSQEPRAAILALVAAGALAAVVFAISYRIPSLPSRLEATAMLWAAAGVTAVAVAAEAAWPIPAAQLTGAVAVLYLFAAALVLVLTGLTLIGELWTPTGAIALLGLRRVPVLTFFAVWFLITSMLNTTDHYHDTRLGPPLPASAAPVSVKGALDEWISQHTPTGTGGGRQQVPMLFVSASGGGIRAAYWTAMVLNCLFSPNAIQKECAGDPLDQSTVFAESGISGGSLGLVTDRVLAGTGRRYGEVLDDDLVSPDAAALAFRDVPLGWVRMEPSGVDRAAVLEQAWERAAGSLRNGLFADARDGSGRLRFPLLLLNGATVDDGCRLNGSVLTTAATIEGPSPVAGTEDCRSLTQFDPGRSDPGATTDPSALVGSKDLYDYLCGPNSTDRHDIALSTAALLSARFPYISPTGALNGCREPQRRTYDLDGGLVETSGVSPLTEIWTRIAGDVQAINDNPAGTVCIQPRLLMIDNGYVQAAPGSAPGQPQELLAPIQGQSQVTDVRSARAEHAAALAFDHAFGQVGCPGTPAATSRVAHLMPVARPGPRAPLGWSLSKFARNDLEEQLNSPANRCQIALVRSWFHPVPTDRTGFCLTGFAGRTTAADQSGPPTVARFTGSFADHVGVAGVRLDVDGCTPTPQITCSVTTDASGRFTLLLMPGQFRTLTAKWGTTAQETVPIPSAPSFVDTSVNLIVTGSPQR
jgi:hypothetical protein